MSYTLQTLEPSTWDLFAELVERNNGVYGGCWCLGFHPEGGQRGSQRQELKHDRVLADDAHAAVVVDDAGAAQGWCQWGSPDELARIKNRRAYEQDPPEMPDWRITCVFVDKRHRGQGVARLAIEGALAQIAQRGGGVVEAISEVSSGRKAAGRFLFTATVELLEELGFERGRQVGKHAWILSRTVRPTGRT